MFVFFRWTRHLESNDSLNNCTKSSYSITCRMNIQSLHPDTTSRTCLTNFQIIDRCGNFWAKKGRSKQKVGDSDALYCSVYTMPVYNGNTLFKNPHCASCNGIKIKNTKCVSSLKGKNMSIIDFQGNLFVYFQT